MATLRSLALVVVCGCSNLQGFGGASVPFATFDVDVTGDLDAVKPNDGYTGVPSMHVALVWGEQWLTEALCSGALPIDPRDDAAMVGPVLLAGCRDPFGFVPLLVETNVPIELDAPASIDLFTLPGADVLVGDIDARVAYGSIVVYDDRDGDGLLDLAHANRLGSANGGPNMNPMISNLTDEIYGASFVTMTKPDQRVGYLEGSFSPVAAFYPRAGCGDPPAAFSVLGAGGFTAAEAIAATLAGTLPVEDDLTMCTETAPADTTITFPVQPPATVSEVACTENTADSSVRYRDPDPNNTGNSPDFTNRMMACVHLPSFGTPSDVVELIVTGQSTDSCKGLTHYVLKGCNTDPNCALPSWDHTDMPPNWWPC